LAMKPTPHIQFRATWSQLNSIGTEVSNKEAHSEVSWWCPQSNAEDLTCRRLAFSYGSHLALLNIKDMTDSNGFSRRKLAFKVAGSTKAVCDILAIEWITSKVLMMSISIYTNIRD
jgi:hypothetical protein